MVMAPLQTERASCFPPYNVSTADIDRNDTSVSESDTQDMQALMYIVCVLLFYSLGIVVGIITYLKREKQDIEESKMFDEFVTLINTSQPSNRLIKVKEVIHRLEQLQRTDNLVLPPEQTEEYLDKHSYSSVFQKSPGEPLHKTPIPAYGGVYETLYNDTMDPVPKRETTLSHTVEEGSGYTSDTDPFQNKRLSQVVAQILDSNPDIGTSEDLDDLDGIGSFSDDESLSTDFIDYKEEPKNKELFRSQLRGIEECDDSPMQTSNFSLSSSDNVFSDSPKAREFCSDKSSPFGSKQHIPESHSREELISPGSSDSATPFQGRWSVTSV